jgi:hypothetical protein
VSFSLPTDEYENHPKKPVSSDTVVMAWAIIFLVAVTAAALLILYSAM